MSEPYIYIPQQHFQYQLAPHYYTPYNDMHFVHTSDPYNSHYFNTHFSSGARMLTPVPKLRHNHSYAPVRNTSRRWRVSQSNHPEWSSFQLQHYPVVPVYNCRNSLGYHTYPLPHGFGDPQWRGPPFLSPPTQIWVNPWINPLAPRADIVFDLAPTTFRPSQVTERGRTALLSPEQLSDVPVFPVPLGICIICDMIPAWPITLDFRSYNTRYRGGPPSPMTLGKVLVEVHKSLHCQVSHREWEILSHGKEQEVVAEYSRRCEAAGNMAEYEHRQGVKRVDFLLGRTRIVGLLRDREMNGWFIMKLVVAGKSSLTVVGTHRSASV